MALAGAILMPPAGPSTALAADTVEPSGEVRAERLSPSARPRSGPRRTRQIPLRVRFPQKLRAAKAAAAAGRAPSDPFAPDPSPTPSDPSSQPAVFNLLNAPGLAAEDNDAQVTPPDTTGAIGPEHYLEFVNSKMAIYARANLTLAQAPVDLDDFVGDPGEDVFDPQIQWDPQSGRWLYVADDVADDGLFLAFGWSKTSDPTDLAGGWCRYRLPTGDLLDDYPKLGHNDSHIIIGANAFDSLDLFVTARIWTIPKPESGSTDCPAQPAAQSFGSPEDPLMTADGDFVFTPVAANTSGASQDGYIVAADDPFFAPQQQIMVFHVTPSGQLVADGNIDLTAAYDFPNNAPQPGTASPELDTLDGRLTQAVAAFDPIAGQHAVWTQHTVDEPDPNTNRSMVRWYELLPASLTARQEGVVKDASHYVFNAAVSPSSSGTDAAVIYNVGSDTQRVQIRARTRVGSTPLGALGSEITLGTSPAANQDFSCVPGPCRWGDYAGASPDPANAHVVWGSNQLNGSPAGAADDLPRWKTRNFALVDSDADTAPPDTAISPGPSGTIASDTATFAFNANEAGSTFECRLDGPGAATGAYAPCTTPKTYANLADGQYTFSVRARDMGGNADPEPATRAFAVDATPPDTTISSGPSGTIASDAATFAFSADEAGSTFECRLDGPGVATGAYASCSSPKAYSDLADGSYTFRVRARDGVGNLDPEPATRAFAVDTTPPDTTISSGPSGPVASDAATFAFSADEAGSTFECRLDGPGAATGAYASCTPPKAYADLADGSYTFRVRARDGVGNVEATPATRAFEVDTTPPDTSISSGPTGTTASDAVSFGFGSDDAAATFECRLDGPGAASGVYAPCTPPKAYADLADGAYTFSVRARDGVGNVEATPATRAFEVDTTPPDTTISSGPSGELASREASFAFGASEAGSTFECRLDGPGPVRGAYASCTSPKAYMDLADGTYTFSVRARDGVGNVELDPATRLFAVDTRPPDEPGSSPLAPVAPDPGAPATPDVLGATRASLAISRRPVVVGRRRIATLRVTCPLAHRLACAGRITLRTARPVKATGSAPRARRLTLGARAFRVAAGDTKILEVRVSRRGYALLRRARRLRVHVTAALVDGGKLTTTLTLRAARQRARGRRASPVSER